VDQRTISLFANG